MPDFRKDFNFRLKLSDTVKRYESTLSSAYQSYRRKWEEYPKEHRVASYPIHLDIESTNQCNLRCIMCPRTERVIAGEFDPIQYFDFDAYTHLIAEGVTQGLCSLKLNILGEPTLHPRLVEMIRYAKTSGILDVMINTNATTLSEELSRQLIESGLDQLYFSFDSPYREQYNRIRIGADYDRVLENIRQFMTLRHSLHSLKPFTRVTMVRMRENKNDWADFQNLFEPLVDAVAYTEYVDHKSLNRPERQYEPLREQKKSFNCPQLWQRLFIHSNGDCRICCYDSFRSVEIGNIHQNPIKDIWLGQAYRHLRQLHAAGQYREIDICAQCPMPYY